MNSTNYFIEYLVAGTLTIFWGFLLFIGFAGIKWLELISLQNSVLFQGDNLLALGFLFLPLVYVTGIVIDRFVNQIFELFFRPKALDNIIPSQQLYNKYVTKIFVSSPELSQNYQSTHMRIRIVRTSTFSSVMTLMSMHIFIWNSGIYNHPEFLGYQFSADDFIFWKKDIILLSIMVSVFMIIAAISSYRAWRNLIITEYKLLRDQVDCLKEINKIS